MHGNYFHITLQMGVFIFKVLILVSPISPRHMLTPVKIYIADMHSLTVSILDVSNVLQNTNVPINEIFCVIPPPC